jgi:hypothetical protein
MVTISLKGGTIVHPKTYFELRPTTVDKGTCFVLMPFADNFKEVYEIIKEALEGPDLNFVCRRADELRGGGHVIEDILRFIGGAEVVIADLTGKNPNVFYELGIAHMKKDLDQVILLTQDAESVPFDLKVLRCIEYKQSIAGGKKLQADLVAAIRAVSQPSFRLSIQQGTRSVFEHKLMGEGNCLYGFEIFGDYFGRDGTKFTIEMTRFAAGQAPEKCGSWGEGIGIGGSVEMRFIAWTLRLEAVSENALAKFVLVHR